MKPGRLTNTLLALIFLALLAHLVVPLLQTGEASAQGKDARSPSSVAATAGVPSLDKIAAEVGGGLDRIAQSNQQIANAILEHARSNQQIARSLKDVAGGVRGLEISSGSTPASRPRPRPEEKEESDPDWWKGYLEEAE
jgi:hypothetical protein